jgi:voltage-gated potassium channel
VQPEHFGSIPRALWWAVCTITTVGYGDVVPMTGIGSIAVPTGILVVGFSEAAEALDKRSCGRQAKRRRRNGRA